MEVLSHFLEASGLRGQVFCRTVASAPWGLRMPPLPQVGLHVVTRGTCWARLHGEEDAVRLLPGDALLLPHGTGHDLFDAPQSPLLGFEDWKARKDRHHRLVRSSEGGGEETHLICGAYRFEAGGAHPLVRLLPSRIHVEAGNTSPALRRALRSLQDEFLQPDIGSPAAVSRLLDVVFIAILRAWLDGRGPDGSSPDGGDWLGALRDPRISGTLAEIHRRPAHPWTVQELAAGAAMSRATFARHFRKAVGEAPLAYLGQVRMALAARLLRRADDNLAAIAHRVGYESEFAFNRAFKKQYGMPPGRYRSQAGESG